MYSSYVLLATVLSILIYYFYILWSGPFQPLLQVEYLNTSLVQLCPWTRKPSRQGEKEEMLFFGLELAPRSRMNVGNSSMTCSLECTIP